MAALLAAGNVQPQQVAALAVVAEPWAVPVVNSRQVGLKASSVVEPGQLEPVLPLARLRQDAAGPSQPVNWLAVKPVAVVAGRAFPARDALQALVAWARQL